MGKSLTGRERLSRIFYGKTPDRPAVKIWGLEPTQKLKHPDYKKIYNLGLEHTDLTPSAESPINLLFGSEWDNITEKNIIPTDCDKWYDTETKVHLPNGKILRSIYRRSKEGKPGRILEYYIKEPEDLVQIMKIPYIPYKFNSKPYFEKEKLVGENGITIFMLPEPIYHIQRHLGSENLAFMSIDNRDLLTETINTLSKRVKHHVIEAFDAGIDSIMGWTGPEICIPPLMSLNDFEDFVFSIDKPIIDLVHENGGRFWAHSHGKMSKLLNRFVSMGVDVLNPIEPPPMGDISLEDAFIVVGDKMGLEGNIEIGEFLVSSEERIRYLVQEAMDAGSKSSRFILCPSSGYMDTPVPTEKLIQNFIAYIEESSSFKVK